MATSPANLLFVICTVKRYVKNTNKMLAINGTALMF